MTNVVFFNLDFEVAILDTGRSEWVPFIKNYTVKTETIDNN